MEKYKSIKKDFEELADQANAIKMQAYMRNLFVFYGIKSPSRREVYKELLKNEKKSNQLDWEFLRLCWDDDHREFQYLVKDYLKSMEKNLVFEDIGKIKYFLKNKQWWDTIDGLDRIIGNIGLKDKRVDNLMLKWSLDDDIWLRRVAIDHQLGRKNQTNLELLDKIILNNLGSDEFFINKAIGWSLREYSKTNQKWVRDFISKNKDKLSKLSIREASKYLG